MPRSAPTHLNGPAPAPGGPQPHAHGFAYLLARLNVRDAWAERQARRARDQERREWREAAERERAARLGLD